MIVTGIDLASTTGMARMENGKLVADGKVKAACWTDVIAIAAFCRGADLVVIENVYMGANVATAIKLAELRGRLIQSLDCNGIPWQLVAPSTWRKATIKPAPKSKRKALKALAITYVLEKYGVAVGEDEADAVCIAEYGTRLLAVAV